MQRRDLVLEAHRDEILALLPRHRAVSISLVGSVARGDDGPDSDYDFVVEFLPHTSLMDVAALHLDLEELLGGNVDLVPADSHSRYWPDLLADAVAL